MDLHARLAELDLTLPDVPGPFGAYVPAVRHGGTVQTAGQLPIAGGTLHATGRLGDGVSFDDARACARLCVVNALAAAATCCDVDELAGVLRVGVFVASTPGFHDQSQVADAASGLLHELFREAGRHARSAVGVAVLPKDAPVEIEVTFTTLPS